MKPGLFHLKSKQQLRASLELQPLPVKYDLRSSKPGEEAIWFARCSCLIRKSHKRRSTPSYSYANPYTTLSRCLQASKGRNIFNSKYKVQENMLKSILRKNCLMGRAATGLELSQHANIIEAICASSHFLNHAPTANKTSKAERQSLNHWLPKTTVEVSYKLYGCILHDALSSLTELH